MGKFLTQTEFLKRAKAIHGNKYDFSDSIYTHSKQKLNVLCKTHKSYFQISPNHLLRGVGCPACAGVKKLTNETFCEKSRKVHGERYNYKHVNYKNYETPVVIICKKHGEFNQRPHAHLDGKGCPVCGGSNPLTTEDFIKRSRKMHGDKYDYSLVRYINRKTKVKIICPEHGEFSQSASGHLAGYECSKCSNNHSPTTKEFIAKATLVHKNHYDYSKSKYVNAHTPLTITCKTHGDFQQKPNTHLRGSGCYLCSLLKKKNTLNAQTAKTLTEDFLINAKLKHGDRYDYSEVKYTNNKAPVLIKCPVHGWTEQFPNSHLKGLGCPQCSNLDVANRNRKGTKNFIERAKEVHGSKYSYKSTIVTTMSRKTVITCKKHGDFEQAAYAHIRGQGCPKCKESNGERIIRVFMEKNDIKYVYQKKFDKCKNESYLFFDFFLPNFNLLIEYDGEQHFGVTRGGTFGGEIGFERRIENDRIKTDFALTEGIELLRINYKQMKQINKILTAKLLIHIPPTSDIAHGLT